MENGMMRDNDMLAYDDLITRGHMNRCVILNARPLSNGNGPKISPDNSAGSNKAFIAYRGVANDNGLRMDKRSGRYFRPLSCEFIDRHGNSIKDMRYYGFFCLGHCTNTILICHGCSSLKPVILSSLRTPVLSTSSNRTASITCHTFTPVLTHPVTVSSSRPQAMCM